MLAIDNLLSLTGDWAIYLQDYQVTTVDDFEQHDRTGRPLGNDAFIEKVEKALKREIKKKKPGSKLGRNNN